MDSIDAAGVAGGVVGALANIGGGFLGASRARQSERAAANLQREFAQHGIQWRVEDAKRAGLHPLAALGMMPTHVQPIALGDTLGPALADAGQSLSRAVTAGQSEDQRMESDLRRKLLEAEVAKTHTETAKIASDMALDHQNRTSVGPALGIQNQPLSSILPEGQQPQNVAGNEMPGVIKLDAPQVFTNQPGDASTASGTNPAGELVQYPGFKMWMPFGRGNESPMEVWNEMPAYEKWGWILHNIQKQGPGWFRDYAGFMMGGFAGGKQQPFVDPGSGTIASSAINEAVRRAVEKGKSFGSMVHPPEFFRQFQRDRFTRNQSKRYERR